MTSLLRSLSSLFTLLHSLRSMLRGSDSAGHPRADPLLDQATAAREAGRAGEARSLFEFEKIEVRAPDMPIVHAFLGPT